MKRLAASYRVDITAPTIAAYWTVFARDDAERFASACEGSIEHERTFPTPAALKAIMATRYEVESRAAGPMLGEGRDAAVRCLTCLDAKFVRKDVAPAHPDFGRLHPCPDCAPAERGPRQHGDKAAYLAFLAKDKAERDALAPYRDEQAARHRFTPVAVAFTDAALPPEGFASHVTEYAGRVPVPTCVTPFVIVAKALGGRRGFVAQWANKAERAVRGDASDWRESREAVRATMANRYADVTEVKG
jgi:hypothetical protein